MSPSSNTSAHTLPAPLVLDCRGRTLVCDPEQPAHVMGILNVTPDSFSDGGRHITVNASLKRAEEMLNEGAAILDIGGESTRPKGTTYGKGASVVSAEEEISRVLPVIEGIVQHFPTALISIDTYKGQVARAALRAGAHIVNDVTGLRYGIGTARAAADFSASLVVMHSLGKPGEMPHEHTYSDVVKDVASSLKDSAEKAQASGVQDVIIDPGFGFGKSTEENLRLIAQAARFTELGFPVLVGISRKSSVGEVLDSKGTPVPVDERLFGSLGLAAMAVMNGVHIVRTHDVKPTVDLLTAISAAKRTSKTEVQA